MAQLTGEPLPEEEGEHNLNEKKPKKASKKDKKSKKIKKHKKKKEKKSHEEQRNGCASTSG